MKKIKTRGWSAKVTKSVAIEAVKTLDWSKKWQKYCDRKMKNGDWSEKTIKIIAIEQIKPEFEVKEIKSKEK